MNASTIKPGDRVKINAPLERKIHGRIGRVRAVNQKWASVDIGRRHLAFNLDELSVIPRMSLPARTLLAAWHASDRTLAKLTDNVCGLHRIRRYGVTAADGLTADLTLTTEVQL